MLPATSNLPPLLFSWMATIGRLLGYVKGPEVNMGKAGRLAFRVAPFTYTKSAPFLLDSF